MRIIHLPVSAGNQAWGLSQEERRLGHSSQVVIFDQNKFHMPVDRVLFSGREGTFKRELKRWALLWEAATKYDVVHLHFGQKFLSMFPRPYKKTDDFPQRLLRIIYWAYCILFQFFDLVLLRILKKKIFMTFHGDDLRQGDLSKKIYPYCIAKEVSDDYYDAYSDERKRRSYKVFSRFCQRLYVVTPDLLDMGGPELKWVPFTGVNFREIDVFPPRALSSGDQIKIVHAPTHRLAKGTRFIESAIEELKAEGFNIDFRLIENLPHSEAMKAYADADLVVDQLLAGWFGVFTLELMAMGKPVVCYLREHSIGKMPLDFQSELPIINANPDNIKSVLKHYLTNPRDLEMVARRSRPFAERYFDPRKTAQNIIADYQSF